MAILGEGGEWNGDQVGGMERRLNMVNLNRVYTWELTLIIVGGKDGMKTRSSCNHCAFSL